MCEYAGLLLRLKNVLIKPVLVKVHDSKPYYLNNPYHKIADTLFIIFTKASKRKKRFKVYLIYKIASTIFYL